MTSVDNAQMKLLMGPGIFHLTVRPSHEMSKSDLITLLAINPQVKQALNNMISETGSECPIEKNPYPKDPPMGHIKWCVDNFDSMEPTIQQSIRDFLEVVMATDFFKGLTVSKKRMERVWRIRFSMVTPGAPSTQPIPGQGGQAYSGQYTPANTWTRREIEKQGNVEPVSNLSIENSKGELKATHHPDATRENKAIPTIVDIREAMTDESTFLPTPSTQNSLSVPTVSGERDMVRAKKAPTQLDNYQDKKLDRKAMSLKRKRPEVTTASAASHKAGTVLASQVVRQEPRNLPNIADWKKQEGFRWSGGGGASSTPMKRVTFAPTSSHIPAPTYAPVQPNLESSTDVSGTTTETAAPTLPPSYMAELIGAEPDIADWVKSHQGVDDKSIGYLEQLKEKGKEIVRDYGINSFKTFLISVGGAYAIPIVLAIDELPKTDKEDMVEKAINYVEYVLTEMEKQEIERRDNNILNGAIIPALKTSFGAYSRVDYALAQILYGGVDFKKKYGRDRTWSEWWNSADEPQTQQGGGSTFEALAPSLSSTAMADSGVGGTSMAGGGPGVASLPTLKQGGFPGSRAAFGEDDPTSLHPPHHMIPHETTTPGTTGVAPKSWIPDAIANTFRNIGGGSVRAAVAVGSAVAGAVAAVAASRTPTDPPIPTVNDLPPPSPSTTRTTTTPAPTTPMPTPNRGIFKPDPEVAKRAAAQRAKLVAEKKYQRQEKRDELMNSDSGEGKRFFLGALHLRAQSQDTREKRISTLKNRVQFIKGLANAEPVSVIDYGGGREVAFFLTSNGKIRKVDFLPPGGRDSKDTSRDLPSNSGTTLGGGVLEGGATEPSALSKNNAKQTHFAATINTHDLPELNQRINNGRNGFSSNLDEILDTIENGKYGSADEDEVDPDTGTHINLGFRNKRHLLSTVDDGTSDTSTNRPPSDRNGTGSFTPGSAQGAPQGVTSTGLPGTESASGIGVPAQDARSNLIPVSADLNTLRASFTEGGADEVSKLNNDPTLLLVNKLGWAAFNNYTWEPNQEFDNTLNAWNMLDSIRHFTYPNDQEELLPSLAIDAKNEQMNRRQSEAFSIPKEIEPYTAEQFFDTVPPPYGPEGPDSHYGAFQDVYMMDWYSMPNDNPWKTFTQVEGSQLPDTLLENSDFVVGNDWSSVQNKNQFLQNVI